MAVAADLRLLAPDHLEVLERRRRGIAEVEPAIAEHRAAGAVRASLDMAQIHPLVPGEVGMRHHVPKATLTGDHNIRNAADCRALSGRDIDEPELAFLFGQQCHVGQRNAATREESHSPGGIEIGYFGNGEWTIPAIAALS
jgi:hypothetical protein